MSIPLSFVFDLSEDEKGRQGMRGQWLVGRADQDRYQTGKSDSVPVTF